MSLNETASDLYKAGKLNEAVEAQIQVVRSKPAEHGQRVFLFELLSFAGDLERARRQIDAVQYDDPELAMAVQSYRKLLDAETFRRRVFEEGIMPQFLGKPPEHLGKRLEALQMLRSGKGEEAAKVLQELNEAAASNSGMLNGKPITGIRDCDDLFGPTLEVMAHGDYYWLPLEQVDSLVSNPPRFPRDLLWMPAKLSVKDGPAGDVFLPAVYPGSFASGDDKIRLGRATDWIEPTGGVIRGNGARIFLVGEDGMPILEWRNFQSEVG